jgi:hypothetical protein
MSPVIKQVDVYLWIIPLSMAVNKPQLFEHVRSKFLPHVIRVAIIVIIIEKCVYNGNGGRSEAAAPLAKSLGYLIE